MGSFDCYCALCSGPLGIGWVKLGSKKAKALRKRKKFVDLQKRNLKGEDVDVDRWAGVESDDEEMEDVPDEEEKEEAVESDWGEEGDDDDDDYEISSSSSYSSEYSDSIESTDSDMHIGIIQDVPIPPPEPEPERDDTWSQTSDLSLWDGFDLFTGGDGSDNYEECRTYDPTLLTREDVNWIDRCRCLAFNAAAPGVTKAFISGRGRYDDYGAFNVKQPGKDPNDTGDDHHSCFYSYDPNEVPAFPFHEACFKILAKSLGYDDVKKVDKDVLYAVMNQCTEPHRSNLNLDYALVQECGQFWENMSGEEYSVCDPSPRSSVEELLQSTIPARVLGAISTLDLGHKVRNDPLAVLPYDVLHDILDRVSVDDTLSLMTASWHVLSSTRVTTFWKHMLRHRISGWFWEWNTILSNTTSDKFDYKGAFLWLDHLTRPEFGMTGPFMGIANRRRIWTAIQELVPLYYEKLSPDLRAEPDHEEAKAILDSALSLHMPIVTHPQPKDVRTTSTQFIRSWQEMTHQSCDFDTYWNQDGALVGIAVTFGQHERVFGSTEGKAGQSLHISSDDWVKEITVYISEVDMFKEWEDRSRWTSALNLRPRKDAGIRGLSVTLKSGKTKELKFAHCNPKYQRPFIVLPHMHLIGLTGQIAADGVISRLGLLQAPHPGEEPSTRPSYTPAQQHLWAASATHVYNNNQAYKPIWAHPIYHLHTLPSPSSAALDIPSDMLPHQLLIWAARPDDYQDLSCLSCLQPVSGKASNHEGSWDMLEIVGISKKHKNGYAPHIGTSGPVACQHPDFHSAKSVSELRVHERVKPWEEADMSHFEIDGPGGEIVTEVHVSVDVKAIKLVTNRGRECYWGEKDRWGWNVKTADEGELIVGLSCCFGKLGGWSWSAKMMSHWSLSDVAVVTMKV